MVDFDFMRSCLKEKIQAKVVFQVKTEQMIQRKNC